MTAENRNNHDVTITGIHLDLTDALKTLVTEKVEKLFHHESHILRIKVDLEYNSNITKQKEYIAKGHIEINGPPLVATAETGDLYKSVDDMVEKLDRMLRRRSRLRKVKRKNTHEVEIPAEIPKAEAV